MASRIETILAAVESALTGLTITGSNVERAAVFPIMPADMPALGIGFGSDEPESFQQSTFITWRLELLVTSYVKATGNLIATTNTIRQEVHAALMANPTLSLAYVLDIEPGEASAPDVSDAEHKIAVQILQFFIQYRTSRTDINA